MVKFLFLFLLFAIPAQAAFNPIKATAPLVNTAGTLTINNFSSSVKGAVPPSGGGTTNFLRADGTWAAPPGGSSPTGGNDTVAYFNDSGVLSYSANLRLNSSGQLILSSLGTGATTANVGAVGTGASLVVGHVAGASSILSTAFGSGSMALGTSESSGQISAQFNGTIAAGYATDTGIIGTENHGSLAIGRADTAGQVSANGLATYSLGFAEGSSIIGANGSGSFAFGYATSNSTINTTTGKFGSFSGGYAASGGDITTGGSGSFAFGSANAAGGSVAAVGDGALAVGRANGVSIGANGTGSLAYGSASAFGITASGEGSLAGGAPETAALLASGLGSVAHGDGNTSSGKISATFGLGNANGSYASLVGGRYASVTGSATSWIAGDTLFALGNGTSSAAKANAFSVTKGGTATAIAFSGPLTGNVTGALTGQVYAPDGGVSVPGIAFNSEQNSGLYRIGTSNIALSVAGAQVLDFKKSTVGGLGNLGMGGPASLSDSYPLLIQRAGPSVGIYQQISNTSTDAYSKATYQLAADAGNNNGEISLFTSATPLAAYANSMTVRPSGNTSFLALIGGDLSTGYVSFFVGGDYTGAGEAFRILPDKSLQFMQEIATPATPAAGNKLYFKSDDKLYAKSVAGTEVLIGPYTAPAIGVNTYTADQTVLCNAGVVLVNSASATVITLPDASTCTAGVGIKVKNINTGQVTVGSTTNIDGASTALLSYRYQAAEFIPANGVWNVW